MNRLVDRLQGVRWTATDRCVALCPAHDDKSPSLSLRCADDGRILIHCFAGCGATDVLAAIGMNLKDLYPTQPGYDRGPVRPNHWHAATDALRILHFEVLIVAVAAETMAAGMDLSQDDRDRLLVAVRRIRKAAEIVR